MKRILHIIWIGMVLIAAAFLYAYSSNHSVDEKNMPTSSNVSIGSSTSISSLTSASTTTQKTVTGSSTNNSSSSAKAAPQPYVTALSYLVGDVDTGQLYIDHNTSYVTPIASISKLFVALVAYANMNTNQVVEITQPMLDVYPDAYGLKLGEKFNVGELIYPLLLQSNNNVAEGLAMTYGYAAFIQKMNDLAKSLGMSETHFSDASGLSPGNRSTAQDLFTFAQYLYKDHKELLALTTTPTFTLASTTDHAAHVFVSIDGFVGDPHLIGGKTGRTDEAGETMLTIFSLEVNGKEYHVAVIVLHSDMGSREQDSEKLLFEAQKVIAARMAAGEQ